MLIKNHWRHIFIHQRACKNNTNYDTFDVNSMPFFFLSFVLFVFPFFSFLIRLYQHIIVLFLYWVSFIHKSDMSEDDVFIVFQVLGWHCQCQYLNKTSDICLENDTPMHTESCSCRPLIDNKYELRIRRNIYSWLWVWKWYALVELFIYKQSPVFTALILL